MFAFDTKIIHIPDIKDDEDNSDILLKITYNGLEKPWDFVEYNNDTRTFNINPYSNRYAGNYKILI